MERRNIVEEGERDRKRKSTMKEGIRWWFAGRSTARKRGLVRCIIYMYIYIYIDTRGCGAHTVQDFVRDCGEKRERRVCRGCDEKQRKNESLTYGAPYGRGVEMGRLRLRHRADGAQGVVQLGGGGNRVPGESSVFVVTSATATSASTAATSATTAATATSAGSSPVRTTATARTSAPAASSQLAQELVLVLDAPFTRPQLQQKPDARRQSSSVGGERGRRLARSPPLQETLGFDLGVKPLS